MNQVPRSLKRRLLSSGFWALAGRLASMGSLLWNYRLVCERLSCRSLPVRCFAGNCGTGQLNLRLRSWLGATPSSEPKGRKRGRARSKTVHWTCVRLLVCLVDSVCDRILLLAGVASGIFQAAD